MVGPASLILFSTLTWNINNFNQLTPALRRNLIGQLWVVNGGSAASWDRLSGIDLGQEPKGRMPARSGQALRRQSWRVVFVFVFAFFGHLILIPALFIGFLKYSCVCVFSHFIQCFQSRFHHTVTFMKLAKRVRVSLILYSSSHHVLHILIDFYMKIFLP